MQGDKGAKGIIFDDQVMESLAVLLTVHNRKDQTITCLEHMSTQSLPTRVKVDVYMVNDGCTDGTEQAVKDKFLNVQIIKGDGSLYWNRGMWTAWDVASKTKKYDYYLWLNDDTELLPHAISSLLTLSADHADKAIIVGATQSKLGDKLTYGGRVGNHIAPCDGKPHEIDHFNGNIVLVPKDVHNILGNLDYYYRHSKGDIDYGVRAKKAGIKMYQYGKILGVCDAHSMIDGWCNPDIPFRRRWILMHQPNGMPPKEIFHLEKQTNVLIALFHYITTYVHCLCPSLWRFRLAKQAKQS